MENFNSPTYPYKKVQSGYVSMKGSELIPKRILEYLLDMPDKNGYVPVDDNSRPRVRLAKYLWYDGAKPLSKALPTPKEKLSMLFDGESPSLNTDEDKKKHPKGYRLYPQIFWGQSQTEAQCVLKCYTGRESWRTPYAASISLVFEILVNANAEGTTRTEAYSRSYNIEQCLIEALHGVNIGGVGVVELSRQANVDNGSSPIADEGTNVGRRLRMSIQWVESNPDGGVQTDYCE